MNKVLSIVESQPARVYIYPCVLAIVAYLVSRGVIDSDAASWITGIVSAVVGVGATEAVHARVVPVAKADPGVDPAADRHA